MLKVKWQPLAKKDIRNIYIYSLQHGAPAAKEILSKIHTIVGLLPNNPRLGFTRQDDDIRQIIVTNTPYIILYLLHKDYLEIMQVFNSCQDPAKIRSSKTRHLEHDA